MNQRFCRFSFYSGLFIFSLFFLRTTEKEFLLSKQSFENSFIIKRFCRFSFYFGLFIFSSFFCKNKRERGLNKGPKALMNQRFTDSLFILGCLFSLCFLQEQERKDFYKGGPSAP
jgi:hypothetical protein